MVRHNLSFAILVASLAIPGCRRAPSSDHGTTIKSISHAQISGTDVVSREFEKVIIPNLVFKDEEAMAAFEYLFIRANAIRTKSGGEFNFSIHRSSRAEASLTPLGSEVPGSPRPPQQATITAEFKDISAMEALRKMCEMTGFQFTITDDNFCFEVIDQNDYSVQKAAQPADGKPREAPQPPR